MSASTWSRDYQDGRNSEAMFDLIELLRSMQRIGVTAKLLLIDDVSVPDMDDEMAGNARARPFFKSALRPWFRLGLPPGRLRGSSTIRKGWRNQGHRDRFSEYEGYYHGFYGVGPIHASLPAKDMKFE